jgi:hypothetical protein
MNVAFTIRITKRHVEEIVKKHKMKILFFFLTSVSVGIVGAVIYNWMYIGGSATIGQVLFT